MLNDIEHTESIALSALSKIIDPEIGVNIVDLGLIYRIAMSSEADGVLLEVDMTATSPTCPMSALLVEQAEAALTEILPPGGRAEVSLVWEPPWTPDLMSDDARKRLGW